MAQRNYLVSTTALSLTASGTTIGSGNTTSGTFVAARTMIRTGIGAGEFAAGTQTWAVHYVVSAMATPYEMRLKVQRLNSAGVMQAETTYGTTRSATGTYDDSISFDLGTWAANDQLAVVWEHRRPSGTGSKNGTIDANGSSYVDAPTPSAGPSAFVTATFTVGSDVTLASYTPELGGPFVLHPSYSGSVLVDAALDRAYLNSSAAAAYYATGAPASADFEVEIDFFRLTQIPANVSIVLRMDTSADTGILLRLNDTGSAVQYEVMDRVAGSNTILNGGTAVTGSHVPSLGGVAVRVKIVGVGTAITVFFDGVQDTALNCTTGITAAGTAGVRCAGQCSSTTGIHIDNFSAIDPAGGAMALPWSHYAMQMSA